MPSRALRWLASLLVVISLGATFSGCSPKEQTFKNQAEKVPTPLDRVREGLTGLVNSGQFDSGTMLIEQDIDQVEGADKEALKKQFTELMAQKSPAAIKAKAKAMLDSLPK